MSVAILLAFGNNFSQEGKSSSLFYKSGNIQKLTKMRASIQQKKIDNELAKP